MIAYDDITVTEHAATYDVKVSAATRPTARHRAVQESDPRGLTFCAILERSS